MKTLLLQLVVLGQVMALLLPAGACSALAADQGVPAPQKPACCQRQAPASEQPDCPGRPAARCCCERDATVSRDDVQLTRDLAVSPSVAAPVDTVEAAIATWSPVTPDGTDPPRHLMLCVWRC